MCRKRRLWAAFFIPFRSFHEASPYRDFFTPLPIDTIREKISLATPAVSE
jgi:hypothetical protein